MSMNVLYEELEQFIRTLRMFNEEMARNWDDLDRSWQHAGELWNDDATRQQFENDWGEMRRALEQYRQQHGERYEDFLRRRKQALDEYFGR